MVSIVTETNRFHTFMMNNQDVAPKSKLRKWTDTNVSEMYSFLALIMMMSHARKSDMKDYWSTDPMLHMPLFGKVMSQDRFFLLLRVIHFCNNENQPENDRLFKIRLVMDRLKQKFSDVFTPFQNLCIDESLMLWKGRLVFKQYIPSKRHRFGVKLFILCDVETCFVMNFIVYTGKNTEIVMNDEAGISGSVVTTLMAPFLDKGHQLFIDNWYTSPFLLDLLQSHNTGACGTVKSNRKDMAKFPKTKKGDCHARCTDTLLAVKWHDKREVHMLSTIHDPIMVATGKIDRKSGEPIFKPECVLKYNESMGAVDKTDMQISFNESARKSLKWYKKFFFHLLDISVLNSYILYQMVTGKKPQLGKFRLEVIRQLLEEHHTPRTQSKGGRPSLGENPLRLTERHFCTFIPPTANKQHPQRQCYVCMHTCRRPKKRKDTRYCCMSCDLGLCFPQCFEDFHTINKF